MDPSKLMMIMSVLASSMLARADEQEYDEVHLNLRGAGSSMPAEVYKSWMAGFKTHRQKFQMLNMHYETVGSIDLNEWMGHVTERTFDIEYASVIIEETGLLDNNQQRFPDLQIFPTVAA
jgi:ABC-type phosphate transport system substrate-binding protein